MEEREPFVGGSGRILKLCFDRANVDKAELFITNSIHCHPPGDRDPLHHESENCLPYLREELREIVRPRLVIGVGRFAKLAVGSVYDGDAEGRELGWPFRAPRPRQSDPPQITYLLFPKHPYWIMTRPAPVREEYVRQVGRAIKWAFALDTN